MEDKTQYEALMEELQKIANNITDVFTELGDILAKILPDIEIPEEEEEDTWKMKCPFNYNDSYYYISINGDVSSNCWYNGEGEKECFEAGNIFKTKEAAKLESKRRNLLTRFRAFRDECNGDWKPDWRNYLENKRYIYYGENVNFKIYNSSGANEFSLFGYFKNEQDAQRAIELFGDEIKELFVDCEEN